MNVSWLYLRPCDAERQGGCRKDSADNRRGNRRVSDVIGWYKTFLGARSQAARAYPRSGLYMTPVSAVEVRVQEDRN